MRTKAIKTISLDTHIIEKLDKEPNASKLINQLLTHHYEEQKNE